MARSSPEPRSGAAATAGRIVRRVSDSAEPTTLRGRAVSKSVDPARQAAEQRVQKFLDAAVELLNSPTGDDFTVQNVVDRSGQSIRAFYLHFGGKRELMLALFEDSISKTAEYLAEALRPVEDPLDRLRVFTTEYYRVCRSGDRKTAKRLPTRAIGTFSHELLYDHPTEASQAFVPLVALLREVLADAASAGAIRDDLDLDQIAGVILQTIMFNAFAATITGKMSDDDPGRGELLWELLLRGVLPPPGR